jgi:hypothetical protein
MQLDNAQKLPQLTIIVSDLGVCTIKLFMLVINTAVV